VALIDAAARELLERPGLLGVICTTRRDGSPSAAPVWFRLDGEAIRIWTDETRLWVKHLQRDPRVVFSVHENERPWACVVLQGQASLDDLSPADALVEIRQIAARYLAPAEIEPYIAGWPETRSIVTVRSTRVYATQAISAKVQAA
jgi:PPOX class probable F420-dependent enzyme